MATVNDSHRISNSTGRNTSMSSASPRSAMPQHPGFFRLCCKLGILRPFTPECISGQTHGARLVSDPQRGCMPLGGQLTFTNLVLTNEC